MVHDSCAFRSAAIINLFAFGEFYAKSSADITKLLVHLFSGLLQHYTRLRVLCELLVAGNPSIIVRHASTPPGIIDCSFVSSDALEPQYCGAR